MFFDSISGKPEYPVITTLANFRLPSFSIFDVICLIKYTNLKLITLSVCWQATQFFSAVPNPRPSAWASTPSSTSSRSSSTPSTDSTPRTSRSTTRAQSLKKTSPWTKTVIKKPTEVLLWRHRNKSLRKLFRSRFERLCSGTVLSTSWSARAAKTRSPSLPNRRRCRRRRRSSRPTLSSSTSLKLSASTPLMTWWENLQAGRWCSPGL